jgi:hypothetical protein
MVISRWRGEVVRLRHLSPDRGTVLTSDAATADPSSPRRFRVVFIDHVARLSGGEIALVRLIEAVRESVEAHVLLGEDGPIRQQLQRAGAHVEVLPMAERLRDVRRHGGWIRISPRP